MQSFILLCLVWQNDVALDVVLVSAARWRQKLEQGNMQFLLGKTAPVVLQHKGLGIWI